MANTLKRTELAFVLDRSGSMSGLESDTIGGFNGLIKKQRAEGGEVTVTTVLFDHEVQVLHDRLPIAGIAPMDNKQYYTRGCTALLDAIGQTIKKVAAAQDQLLPAAKADQVIVVITTDGMENASVEYTYKIIHNLITEKQAQGWEFIFMGANIDAVAEAKHMGIDASRAVQFHNDSQGVALNYDVVGEAVLQMRTCGKEPVGAKWKSRIEDDYKKRKK